MEFTLNKAKSSEEQPANAAIPDDIEKVRDLLFGRQHNEVQQDIFNLAQALSTLKALVETNHRETTERLDAIDKKIAQHYDEANESLDSLNANVLSKETAILATISSEISGQKRSTSNELAKTNEAIAGVQSHLEKVKVGRLSLANQFNDFANQLRAIDGPEKGAGKAN